MMKETQLGLFKRDTITIAIDFDNTVVYSTFPVITGLKPNVKEIINRLYDDGNKIIINTCRAGIHEAMVYIYLNEVGIKYHYINSNLPEAILHFKQDCRKISANVYIDDKCLMGIPEDWKDIYKILQEKFNV